MKRYHDLLLAGLLMLINLSGCCMFFDCHTHKTRGQFTICTQLLDEYHMSVDDLKGLEVQLNQELLIKRRRPDRKAGVDPRFRSLVINDDEYYELIRFRTSLTGCIRGVGEQQFDGPIDKIKSKMRVWLGQPKRRVLEVYFEEGGTLPFISTDSGWFELETSPDGKYVKYFKNKYECVYGGAGNSLVVDGDYFYDFYMTFYHSNGIDDFKQDHPKHWR